MSADLLRVLTENRGRVGAYIDELFGHHPPKPEIAIGQQFDYLGVSRGQGMGDSQILGFCLSDYRLIGIDPIAIMEDASEKNKMGIRINPDYGIVRTFAKEYAQHVYSDLHRSEEIYLCRSEEIYMFVRREQLMSFVFPLLEKGGKDGVRELVKSFFPLIREEAFGLVGMLNAARFFNHDDDYEKAYQEDGSFAGAKWTTLVWELTRQRDQKSAIRNVLLDNTPAYLSYLVAREKLKLNSSELREDLRRPPYTLSDGEIDLILVPINEVFEHFNDENFGN